MFSFFKKKKVLQRGPLLEVDLHSHLIPGIDDGSHSMDESLSLIKGLSALGYKKLITTPHIMSDAYKNGAENINAGLKELQEAVKKKEIPVEIEAAAEYYLDDMFYEELKKPEVMSIRGKYLLFESSYFSKPMQMEEMVFAVGTAGYLPILAHPERYRYIKDPDKEYRRLKELGVLFQVNLNSFGGHYGKNAKALAHFLSEKGMIDFLGSDTHHQKQVKSLMTVFHLEAYHHIFKYNQIKNNELL
ncbi:tyrosine-protein phosphatase [Sulfurovum sp. NBC37-1]|uniref:tyrosine-protein phosphatase n=1 Tax=Sulfurovum sp. (strain NBC37-1) TaxID=387093 RepID=UPI0001587BAC|nr:CpsB/CapC family capsule biosynthesis tyrosine phosphatase [Sulfurovum sp. NBC37-1]BAF72508.1 capsular polysaccharide biosynthesis protein [Sulfurovum sp. NBC37-1]